MNTYLDVIGAIGLTAGVIVVLFIGAAVVRKVIKGLMAE